MAFVPPPFAGPSRAQIIALTKLMIEDTHRTEVPSPNDAAANTPAQNPVYLSAHPSPFKIVTQQYVDTLINNATAAAAAAGAPLPAAPITMVPDPNTHVNFDASADVVHDATNLIRPVMRAMAWSIKNRASEFAGPYRTPEVDHVVEFFRSPPGGRGLTNQQIQGSSVRLNNLIAAIRAAQAAAQAGGGAAVYAPFQGIPAAMINLLVTTHGFNDHLTIPAAMRVENHTALETALQIAKPTAVNRALAAGGIDALYLMRMLDRDITSGDLTAEATIASAQMVAMLAMPATIRSLKISLKPGAIAAVTDRAAITAIRDRAEAIRLGAAAGAPVIPHATNVRDALDLILQPTPALIAAGGPAGLGEISRLATSIAAGPPDGPSDAIELREALALNNPTLVGVLRNLSDPILIPHAGVVRGELAAVLASIQQGPVVAERLAAIVHGGAAGLVTQNAIMEATNALQEAIVIPTNIPHILAAIVHAEANAAAPVARILRTELNGILTAQPAAAPALIAELVRIGLAAGTPEAVEANGTLAALIGLGGASLDPLIAALGVAGVPERNLLIQQMVQALRVAGRGQLALDLAEKIRTIGGVPATHIAKALEEAVTVNRVALENLLEGVSIAGTLGALADADELKDRITAVCVAAGGEAVIKELAEIIINPPAPPIAAPAAQPAAPVPQTIEDVAREVLGEKVLRALGGVNNFLSAISTSPLPLAGYADELNRLLITDMGLAGGEATATALATAGIPGATHAPIARGALWMALGLGGASTQNVLTALGDFAGRPLQIAVIKDQIAGVLRIAGREAATNELAAAVVAGHAAAAHIIDVIESECVREIPLSNILEVIRDPATPAANRVELKNRLGRVMQGPRGPALAIELAETAGIIGPIADTEIAEAIRVGGAALEAVMQAIEDAPTPLVAARLKDLVTAELSAGAGPTLAQRLAALAATAAPGVVVPGAAEAGTALKRMIEAGGAQLNIVIEVDEALVAGPEKTLLSRALAEQIAAPVGAGGVLPGAPVAGALINRSIANVIAGGAGGEAEVILQVACAAPAGAAAPANSVLAVVDAYTTMVAAGGPAASQAVVRNLAKRIEAGRAAPGSALDTGMVQVGLPALDSIIAAGGPSLTAVIDEMEAMPFPAMNDEKKVLRERLLHRLAELAPVPGAALPGVPVAAALITAGAAGNAQAQVVLAAVHALPAGSPAKATLAAAGMAPLPHPVPIVHAFHAAVAPPVAVAAGVAAPVVVPPVAVGPAVVPPVVVPPVVIGPAVVPPVVVGPAVVAVPVAPGPAVVAPVVAAPASGRTGYRVQ